MTARTAQVRAQLIADHVVTPYYDQAEAAELADVFWGTASPFLFRFELLDLRAVLELGCGRGRHAVRYADRAGSLVLVDPVQDNLDACRTRLAGLPHVEYRRNNGRALAGVPDASLTAVLCYDAMVHFEAADVIAYLAEIGRVLEPGGKALLHYSIDDSQPGATYRDHPRWRSYFSEGMMRHFAQRAGLSVEDHAVMSWPPQGYERPTDGLAVLRA